jgi:ABC-2 type transport system ATP-binding protein
VNKKTRRLNVKVQIYQVSKTYGKFKALDKISLSIPGGMFGLLGPNGAGKTTLMRIITALIPPSSGQVIIDGKDVIKEPQHVRKLLGYIPQDFGFYKNLRAWEMLDYIGAMKNIPFRKRKGQVETVLEEVNLTREASRRVGTFSGGMKQRLGIAQALLGDPELIVVDEPTAGLDPEERIRFRNLLAHLSRNRTVILSTHIVGDIEASCSGLAVLNHGKLAFSGEPQELVNHARGRVWQVSVPPEVWRELELRYMVLSSRSVNGNMEARLLANQAPIEGSHLVEPGLEDGYIAVMDLDNRVKNVPHA